MRVSGTCKSSAETPQLRGEPGHERLLLSVARPGQLERLFARLFDEAEFLSPHGLRALSAYHRDHPYGFDVEGYRACHRLSAGSSRPRPVCSAATSKVRAALAQVLAAVILKRRDQCRAGA